MTSKKKPSKKFTEKQQSFLHYLAEGLSQEEAAKKAWGAGSYAREKRYMENESLALVTQTVQKALQTDSKISRQDVLDGFTEAIEIARINDDSGNMIKGYVEIMKMLGYNQPEKKIHEHVHRAERDVQELSTEELLELAGQKPISLDKSDWTVTKVEVEKGADET